MARPAARLIAALRETADRLESGAQYSWSHQGSCNCGHLAQTITRLDPAALHVRALEVSGDWSEHANDYCPASGRRIDDVIEAMLAVGLETADIERLEKLSDLRVLQQLPVEQRNLKRNRRDDVIVYMRAWADLLENERRAALTVRWLQIRATKHARLRPLSPAR